MQLTIDSTEPLAKVLAVIGALYGVELAAPDGAVATSARTRAPATTTPAVAVAKTRGRGTRKASTRPSRRAPAARPDPTSVRRWAKANRHDVRDRGPLPGEVIAAYLAAGAPDV